jgi:hypothetical protein
MGWVKNFIMGHIEKMVCRWRSSGSGYCPSLVGMRVLDNGRLALAFWNDATERYEFKVVNVWESYSSYRGHSIAGKWFDPDFFKGAFLFHGMVYWPSVGELPGSDLYGIGTNVELPAGESEEAVFGCLK